MVLSDEEYYKEQELRWNAQVIEKRLEKVNKGYTFDNIDAEKRKLKIEFLLEVKMNLEERNNKIIVKTNIEGLIHYGGSGLKDFFKDLNEFATGVYYIPQTFNRKGTYSAYRYNNLPLRDITLNFADINIVVYEQARDYLKSKNIDVVDLIKKSLNQQRNATTIEKNAVDRYTYLCEQIDTLNSRLKKSNDYGYYGQDRDKTIKLEIDKKEYNKELKIIEGKLKTCIKKFPLLEMPKLRYEEIIKKPSYKVWLKGNKQELDDNYNNDDDYNDYCKENYNNYLEMNDFDE